MKSIRAYAVSGSHLVAYGDTYLVRSRLKELGARFLPQTKSWQMPHTPEVVEQLLALGFSPEQGLAPPPASHGNAGALERSTMISGARAVSISDQSPVSFALESPRPPAAVREFSVAELCVQVDQALQRSLPEQFWVVGELVQVQPSRGHVWLELADHAQLESFENRKRASVSGVLWSGVLTRLKRTLALGRPGAAPIDLPLEVGLRVRLLGHLDFRAEGSRLLFVIDDVDTEFTQGQLALTRERMIAELRKRGLMDLNRRIPMRPFPLRIALITANDSRARNDFLHELERSGLSFRVTLFDCRMQGEDASSDFGSAFQLIRQRVSNEASRGQTGQALDESTGFDVVVVTRGGGSRMDLRWFDDLELCKAIASCPVPVITAIGHFEDVSIADMVSSLSEKTPTAAAQALVSRCGQSLAVVQESIARMGARAMLRLKNEQVRLENTVQRMERAALARVAKERQRVDALARLVVLAERQFGRSFQKGFALLWDLPDGRPLDAQEMLSSRHENIWIEIRQAVSRENQETWERVLLPARIDYSSLRREPVEGKEA